MFFFFFTYFVNENFFLYLKQFHFQDSKFFHVSNRNVENILKNLVFVLTERRNRVVKVAQSTFVQQVEPEGLQRREIFQHTSTLP